MIESWSSRSKHFFTSVLGMSYFFWLCCRFQTLWRYFKNWKTGEFYLDILDKQRWDECRLYLFWWGKHNREEWSFQKPSSRKEDLSAVEIQSDSGRFQLKALAEKILYLKVKNLHLLRIKSSDSGDEQRLEISDRSGNPKWSYKHIKMTKTNFAKSTKW